MEREARAVGEFGDGSEKVIGALIEVHRILGPGMLESVYEACVCRELELREISFERQRAVRVSYKGLSLDAGYRIDLLVEGRLLVEIKAVEHLLPVHAAQTHSYMRLAGVPTGLLANFNVCALRQGLKRLWLPPQPF